MSAASLVPHPSVFLWRQSTQSAVIYLTFIGKARVYLVFLEIVEVVVALMLTFLISETSTNCIESVDDARSLSLGVHFSKVFQCLRHQQSCMDDSHVVSSFSEIIFQISLLLQLSIILSEGGTKSLELNSIFFNAFLSKINSLQNIDRPLNQTDPTLIGY